jgi:hypothetical protein
MPYKLVRKDGTDKYFVMTTDTGRLHSKEPLTKEMAKRQMTALNLAHARKKGYDVPPPPPSVKRKPIKMPYEDYMREHRQLISILSLAGKEGERQRREMNKYI